VSQDAVNGDAHRAVAEIEAEIEAETNGKRDETPPVPSKNADDDGFRPVGGVANKNKIARAAKAAPMQQKTAATAAMIDMEALIAGKAAADAYVLRRATEANCAVEDVATWAYDDQGFASDDDPAAITWFDQHKAQAADPYAQRQKNGMNRLPKGVTSWLCVGFNEYFNATNRRNFFRQDDYGNINGKYSLCDSYNALYNETIGSPFALRCDPYWFAQQSLLRFNIPNDNMGLFLEALDLRSFSRDWVLKLGPDDNVYNDYGWREIFRAVNAVYKQADKDGSQVAIEKSVHYPGLPNKPNAKSQNQQNQQNKVPQQQQKQKNVVAAAAKPSPSPMSMQLESLVKVVHRPKQPDIVTTVLGDAAVQEAEARDQRRTMRLQQLQQTHQQRSAPVPAPAPSPVPITSVFPTPQSVTVMAQASSTSSLIDTVAAASADKYKYNGSGFDVNLTPDEFIRYRAWTKDTSVYTVSMTAAQFGQFMSWQASLSA